MGTEPTRPPATGGGSAGDRSSSGGSWLARIPGLEGIHPVALAKATFREYLDDDMPTYAAALSYHTFFALFPFLLFLLALLSFLELSDLFDWLIEQAARVLPSDALAQVVTVMEEVRDEDRGGLLSLGILTTIWIASAGLRSVMNALNGAYDVEEGRPVVRRYLLSVVYTVGLALLIVTATALMVIGPGIASWLFGWVGLGPEVVTLWEWLRLPAAGVLLIVAISLVYHLGPNIHQRFRVVTPGAIVAVVLWIVAAQGFSYYVSNFARYSVTYGSIGAIIVLMLYIFISASVLLLGAELNAEIRHRVLGRDGGEAARKRAERSGGAT